MTKINDALLALTTWLDVRNDAERGQGLVEYALIIALVAIACIAALVILGGDISNVLNRIGGNLK